MEFEGHRDSHHRCWLGGATHVSGNLCAPIGGQSGSHRLSSCGRWVCGCFKEDVSDAQEENQ